MAKRIVLMCVWILTLAAPSLLQAEGNMEDSEDMNATTSTPTEGSYNSTSGVPNTYADEGYGQSEGSSPEGNMQIAEVLDDTEDQPNVKELNRTNCHDELLIGRWETLDVTYRIDNGHTNTSEVRCEITLKTMNQELMAISIKNIHLNDGEMLQVVTWNNNITFLMKQFFGNETQESLLLPDTSTIHIVFSSKPTQRDLSKSSFDLKAFSYRQDDNLVDSRPVYGGSSHAEDIYITTSEPQQEKSHF